MAFQLTKQSLKSLCKELNLYSSLPGLNDVLYLQHKGITKLENLEEYTGIKTLYLECNAISTIEGLDELSDLRCLYIGKNIIRSLEGLSTLSNLQTLDVSNNDISSITHLDHLPHLTTLNLAGNKLQKKSDVEHLSLCCSITSIDLSSNRLDCSEAMDLVTGMTNLSLLRLVGNPIVSKTRSYRKHVLVQMPNLQYLDDSPCFQKERRLAESFMAGGIAAERAMRDVIRAEEAASRTRYLEEFNAMVKRAKEKAIKNPPPPRDPLRFTAPPEQKIDQEDAHLPVQDNNRESSTSNLGDVDDKETSTTDKAHEKKCEEEQQAESSHAGSGPRECELDDCIIDIREIEPEIVDDCMPKIESSSAHFDQDKERSELCEEKIVAIESSETTASLTRTECAAEKNPNNNDTGGVHEGGLLPPNESLPAGISPQKVDSEAQKQMDAIRNEIEEEVGTFGIHKCRHMTKERLEGKLCKQRSPTVWGTPAYAKLWNMALQLGKEQQNESPPFQPLSLNSMEGSPSNNSCPWSDTADEENRIADEAAHVVENNSQGQSGTNIPIQSQYERIETDRGYSGLPAASPPESTHGSGAEASSDGDSEWEFTFDDADPLARYTITTVSGGSMK